MKRSFFNSQFAKFSKFDYDFVGNIENKNEWILLANQFLKYLNKDEDRNISNQKIPKIIHQIWLGNKKLPKKYYRWMNSWKFHNHDWEYKLWNDQNIKELNIENKDIYSKEINPGYRSDILRYILLKNFGGIYVDTDFECIRPIPNYLLRYKFVSCTIFDNKPSIANGMMMSSPNFILINNILKAINTKDYKNNIENIINNSGPAKLTKEYFLITKDIEKDTLILPSNYFYPYPNFMLNSFKDRYKEIENSSIGIHHWEMSWMKGNIFNRIILKLRKLIKLIQKKVN